MPQDKVVSAKPAQVEDYDSDNSRVVPETVVQASHAGRSSRTLKPTERSSHRRDTASDSGYSSHASAPLASAASRSPAPAPTTKPAHVSSRQPQSPVKSKPILHGADSARSTQKSQTVSNSTNRCSDSNCRDPNCQSQRNPERRHTFYQKPTQQSQYTSGQYQSVPHYQYASANTAQMNAAQAMPPPARPRSGSHSRTRPLSINGGYPYDSTRTGPPPSASAYYSSYYPQPGAQYQPGTTPPTQMAAYPPQSPIPQTPTSPLNTTYPGYPGYTGNFSARKMNPNVPGLESFSKPSTGPGLTRTLSARRPNERSAIPGKFPDPESTDSDSASSSGSECSSSEDEDVRRRRRRSYQDPRAQDRRSAIVPSSRRPSVTTKYYTTTAVPTKSRRDSQARLQEPLQRAPRSDTGLDYPSSSDINESDRTQRAVVDRPHRRSTLSSPHSSRRQSVSTSSTKATSLSSMTDYSRVIIESPSGRRSAYLSKEQQADLIRRLQQQKLEDKLEEQRMREEKVAAYQRNIGGEPYELTAENVKAQNRKSGSHSYVSRKSSNHSGSKASRSDGIKIKSGDTVLHVYGDAKIEMRPSEDGGAPQLVIASTSGRDSAYQGSSNSKSSGSRMGRSRASRRDRVIREEELCDEGGFEKGY